MEKPFFYHISLKVEVSAAYTDLSCFVGKKYNALVYWFQCEFNSVTMHLHIHRNMTDLSAVCSAGLAQAEWTNQNGAPTALICTQTLERITYIIHNQSELLNLS